MGELIKIREVSLKYDISARALKYYEDMGLISSARSDDYAYRMYDEAAIKRLEQILILRKLNISIKDIQRIFGTAGSEAVLDVLGRKVDAIDEEVSLLHELREIVLEFIRQIKQADFGKDSDVKMLYEKASEIEKQIVNVEYEGNAANVNRLVAVSEKLDKQIPDVMIVKIPKFRAVSGDFGGLMGWAWHKDRLKHYFKNIMFDCPDFVLSKGDKLEYMMAIRDNITEADTAPYEIFEFEGGLYAMAMSINEDRESIHKVEGKILRWLETTNFEYDNSRSVMGNLPYFSENPNNNKNEYDDILKGLGYLQLQRYIPIKIKE